MSIQKEISDLLKAFNNCQKPIK